MALRVLLADESSTIKRVMQLALQDFGVEVKSVPVGLDVLPVTKTFKPDIIFADVLLAKRNGYEVCSELKADGETRSVPVVLMWSGFMEIDEAKMTQAGPDAHLEKPFDADALRQLVQDLVPKTNSNPVSPYLQFPKMPEFSDAATSVTTTTQQPSAPAAATHSAPQAPSANKPASRIPETAPVNFDTFDPNVKEDSLFSIPEEHTDPAVSVSMMDLPMVDDPEANPEESFLVADDEEFASVPLQSAQQKDLLEDDGWQRQDLKKFKIQVPPAPPAEEEEFTDDFAKKFVIPQDELENAHIETEGEFEEIHFNEDLTATKTGFAGTMTRTTVPQERTSIDKTINRTSLTQQTRSTPTAAPQTAVKPAPSRPSEPGVTVSAPNAEMIERVIREEAREVIESICWKVIPEMAERIVREEIQKILREVEKST